MAAVPLTVTSINTTVSYDVTTGTAGASADGWTVKNELGDVWVFIKNSSGGSLDATIVGQSAAKNTSYEDLVITVPAGENIPIGPFSRAAYNDANNNVTITLDASFASMSANALRFESLV